MPDPVHPTPDFKHAATAKRKRPMPFSLRLSTEERAHLEARAGRTPLGAYIKAKALADTDMPRKRAVGLDVEDRKALSRALALLGQSRLSSNLNQLAKAANIGTLSVSPEVATELSETCTHVREIKALLIQAVGLKDSAS